MSEARVRFAPSPTGYLHIGGVRTAIYNWLFAKGSGGKFILRIEDTDTSRSTEESINEIKNSLIWLGLDWDEGPFRQTERLDIYNKYINELLSNDYAYYCYCSSEQLAVDREESKRKKVPYKYSGRCIDLSEEKISEYKSLGIKPTLRFKAGKFQSQIVVDDLVYGVMTFNTDTISDFIIQRRDGMPTYNFAAAIDDIEMDITHVIRGSDHISNTPKQIMIYKAVSKKPPIFAHLPLIVGADRQPLSKRHGEVSVEEFRKGGYIPETMINYLSLLGWSYDDKTTIFSVNDLIEKFSFSKVSKSPAMFDIEKLKWMNGYYLRSLSVDELADKLSVYLKNQNINDNYLNDMDKFKRAVEIVQEKIKTLDEFTALNDFIFKEIKFGDEILSELKKVEDSAEILRKVRDKLKTVEDFNSENLDKILRNICDEIGLKPSKIFQLIRMAVSGKKITAGLFESLELLGKEKTIQRINNAIDLIKS